MHWAVISSLIMTGKESKLHAHWLWGNLRCS